MLQPCPSFHMHLSVKGYKQHFCHGNTTWSSSSIDIFFGWYFRENAMIDKESTTWRIILKDRRIINLSVC